MGAQLKAGVIGLGILGGQHVHFLQEQPEVTVAAVTDIRSEVAQATAGAIGAVAYSDYEQMLREQALDIAVVATPDPLHKEPVLAAIAAGVPTIIQEKPMATTAQDALDMFDAAARAGIRLFVNFANRGSALDRGTHYVIQHGLLGDVVYGDVHLDDNILVPTKMWGARSREWGAGSSTAHFLLSHVVDYLRWVLAPADVTEACAIVQNQVLGFTPDLYDAFLTFDSGAKIRVRAEWIKHIDGLVEFALHFSGSEGGLVYIKRPGFGEVEGWRANVSDRVTTEELIRHQTVLERQGISVRALIHRPSPAAGALKAGGGQIKRGLETFENPLDWWRVARGFVDAILEDTLTPSSWRGYGPLPTAVDGLRQAQIVAAIVESAAMGRAVECSQ